MSKRAPWMASLSLSFALACAGAATAWADTPPVPAPQYLSIAQLRAKYADRVGRIAVIKGVEIYYKDEGAGPAIMLVHGSQSSLRIWDTTVARLKSRYRLIRFDMPAMGLSGSVSDEAAATVDPVDIPVELMKLLKVDKVTFVGNSSGGTLGMFLAAKHPEKVQRLVLMNTPSDVVRVAAEKLVEPESFRRVQAEAKANGGFQSLEFWNEFLDYFSGDGKRISPRIRGEYYDFNRREKEKHPIALIAQIGDGVVANQLMAKVTTPTLLLWGAKDQLLPVAAMKSLEKRLSSAPVSEIVMPDVGHYPPLEVPDRITTLVQAYIEAAVPAEALR